MTSSYKFNYFPDRGLSEVSREMFLLSGTPFKENRIRYEDWRDHKTEAHCEQLPSLEVDGKEIHESFVIARFLADKFGFNGQNANETGLIESIAHEYVFYFAECRPFLMNVFEFSKGDMNKLRKEIGEPARDKFFPKWEKRAQENGSNGHLVGNSLTWIDLLIAYHVDTILTHIPGFFDKYPKIVALRDTVKTNPKIKEWLEHRQH